MVCIHFISDGGGGQERNVANSTYKSFKFFNEPQRLMCFKSCMLKDFSFFDTVILGRQLEKKTVQVHRVTEKSTHLWHALFMLKKIV